jgi:hypothetical protein
MHEALEFLSRYKTDIWLAAFFGFLFYSMTPDSLPWRGFRYLRNKWAERSAKDLRKRIEQLEWYRNNLSSDKGLYLITLRLLLLLLTMISAGLLVLASTELAGRVIIQREGAGLASVAFAVAVVAGIQGVRYASLDSREKAAQMIGSLDKSIAKMKAKLPNA